jgi:Uma2 family endonuclease
LVPDISIYASDPREEVPTTPGLAAIEIVSPDDRWSALRRKLRLLWEWGVPHVWAVDPDPRTLYVYDASGFHQVQRLEMPERGFVLTAERIFP